MKVSLATTTAEIPENPEAARCKPLYGEKAMPQARLAVREVGSRLSSTIDMRRDPYLGGRAPILARAPTGLSGTTSSDTPGERFKLLLAKAIIKS